MHRSQFAPATFARWVVLLTFVPTVAVVAHAWSLPPTIRLSDGLTAGTHSPVMALDAQGHIDVAWSEPDGIFFRRSTDHGVSFSTAFEIQAAPVGQIIANLQIGVDADANINLLWATFHPTGAQPPAIFLTRSTDGGLTFSSPQDLVPNFGGSAAIFPRMLVHPDGDIDIVDSATLGGASGLFFARSTDGGLTFPNPVQIASIRRFARHFSIEPGPQGQIYVFWVDTLSLDLSNVLFSRSLDGGTTFSSPLNISNGPVFDLLGATPLVDRRGNIDVAWSGSPDNGTSFSIVFSRSNDDGSTFSVPKSVSGGFFTENDSQQMVVDSDGEISLAWQARSRGAPIAPILFSRSLDDGDTFSTPAILSHVYQTQPGLPPSDIGVGAPAIAVDHRGNLSIAYGENDASALFFRRSTDEGTTFSNPLDLSPVFPLAVSQLIVDRHDNAYILSVGVGFPVSNVDVYFSRVPASAELEGDFRIRVSPKSQTASQGQTLHFTVTARKLESHHDVVALSCSDLPFTVPVSPTCTFNPPSLTATRRGATSDLTLTIPANQATGAFLFSVNGVAGSTIDTQTVEVTVQ